MSHSEPAPSNMKHSKIAMTILTGLSVITTCPSNGLVRRGGGWSGTIPYYSMSTSNGAPRMLMLTCVACRQGNPRTVERG